MRRVAIVFDDETRPETTGGYCLRALREIVEVEHFRPRDLPNLPRSGFDLYLFVDDGLDYPIPEGLRPSAFWAIDTHIDFKRALGRSRLCDLVFAAQRDGTAQLRAAGIARAQWLPLACDPSVHRPHAVPKQHDLCFVGNILPGPREELVQLLRARYPGMHVARAYFDDMARDYSASRIVFNRSVAGDVNMRVFEALACGSLLVTNDLAGNGQDVLFEPRKHLITYRDAPELCDRIDFYLAHDAAREEIAARGRDEVLARHTYRQRMETIVSALAVPAAGSPDHRGHAAPARLSCSSSRVPTCGAYFEFARPELAALVPADARRVLDVGCGAGRLGALIKEGQGAIVWGIELDPRAGECARTRLDHVLTGDVEQIDIAPEEPRFDCVICGDILEHVRRPLALLRKIRTWLAVGGRLVASIPNVRHRSVVESLLEGNWTYEAAGLLDRTHVRFFMKSSISRLFQEAGFRIVEWRHTSLGDYEDWVSQGRPASVKVGTLTINGSTSEETQEFFVYQHLVVACSAS